MICIIAFLLISVVHINAQLQSLGGYSGLPLQSVYGQPNAGFYSQQLPLMARQLPFQQGMSPVMAASSMQNEGIMMNANGPSMLNGGGYPMSRMGGPLPMGGMPMGGMPMGGMGGIGGGSPMMMDQMNQQEPPQYGFPNGNMFAARRGGVFGMGGGQAVGPSYDFSGLRASPDMMQSYPGQSDGSMMPGGPNMLGSYPMPGGFRGDGMSGVSGVSYFPFARIRPGPGLVIVSSNKDQEESGSDLPLFSILNGTDNVFNNDTDSAVFNGTASDAFPFNANTTVGLDTSLVPVNSNATVVVPTAGNPTTPAPCTHPVYMSRVFMSTALSMGLISANTSCVVLLDH